MIDNRLSMLYRTLTNYKDIHRIFSMRAEAAALDKFVIMIVGRMIAFFLCRCDIVLCTSELDFTFYRWSLRQENFHFPLPVFVQILGQSRPFHSSIRWQPYKSLVGREDSHSSIDRSVPTSG